MQKRSPVGIPNFASLAEPQKKETHAPHLQLGEQAMGESHQASIYSNEYDFLLSRVGFTGSGTGNLSLRFVCFGRGLKQMAVGQR